MEEKEERETASEGAMLRAVILAAGCGKRLLPFTRNHPKPLLSILGKPLLEHVILKLRYVGVKYFIIVTGHLGQAIRSHFGDGSRLKVKIRYAHNQTYVRGNGTSLKVAEEFVRGEPFLLSMADHLIDARILEKALQNFEERPLLCVDRKPRFLRRTEDATKVLVDSNGYVENIGKNIPHWNGIDTGVFLLNGTIFEAIRKVEANPVTLSSCIKRLIKSHPLWACDVSGAFWLDVDTWGDITFAREVWMP